MIWPMRSNLKVQAASGLSKAARVAKSTIDCLFSHASALLLLRAAS